MISYYFVVLCSSNNTFGYYLGFHRNCTKNNFYVVFNDKVVNKCWNGCFNVFYQNCKTHLIENTIGSTKINCEI